MEDFRQFRVSGHMTGIVGLNEALHQAGERCEGLSDVGIGRSLAEILSYGAFGVAGPDCKQPGQGNGERSGPGQAQTLDSGSCQ